MLFPHWLFFTVILVVMTAGARFMYRVMLFGIHKLVPETMPDFLEERALMQVYILLLEWFVLRLFNMIRRHVITSSLVELPYHLRTKLVWLVYYATGLWVLSMGFLSWELWHEYGVLRWAAVGQLLMINIGMGVMMGITLPYCNLRYWDRILQDRKRKTGANRKENAR